MIPAKTASNPCESILARFTEKLDVSLGWSLLAALKIIVASSLSSCIGTPSFALIIRLASRKLFLRFIKVLAKFIGTRVISSIPLSLIPPLPSFLNTPMTLVLFPATVICLPTGSDFSNNLSPITAPTIATFFPDADSSGEKYRPFSISNDLTFSNSFVAAHIVTSLARFFLYFICSDCKAEKQTKDVLVDLFKTA